MSHTYWIISTLGGVLTIAIGILSQASLRKPRPNLEQSMWQSLGSLALLFTIAALVNIASLCIASFAARNAIVWCNQQVNMWPELVSDG